MRRLIAVVLIYIFLLSNVNFVYSEDYNISETFDIASGVYVEKIDNGIEFLSSVPQGAVVSDGVYFDIPLNINVQLLHDGAEMPFENKSPIASPGYYILKLSCSDKNAEVKTGIFTFRISNPPQDKKETAEYKYPKISCQAEITADSETGLNKYTLPNYKAFYSSLEGYGQTVESAKFIIPRNLGYSFKLNGNNIPLINNKVYTQSGSYSLKVFGYSYASSGGYEASYETQLDFNIPAEQPEYDISIPNMDISDINLNVDEPSNDTAAAEATAEKAIADSTGEEQVNIDDALEETFFEEAGVYSETFSNGDAFYTNTPNDGIVGGNVYLDIPHNMQVEMTKDGVNAEFKNKEYINEPGIYSFIVTDTYDGGISKARYSFKIQRGAPMSTKALDNNEEDSEQESEEESAENYSFEKEMFFYTIGEDEIFCSVPDGMISNEPVKLSVPENFETTLKRNDEEVEYSKEVSDNGRYELNVKDEAGNEATITFYVVQKYAGFIDEIILPDGYSVFLNEFNDIYEKNSDEDIQGLQYSADSGEIYQFSLEGEYSLEFVSNVGMPDMSVSVIIDRTAPEVTFDGLDKRMGTKKKSVDIACDDKEAIIRLVSGENQEEIELTDGKATINAKGKYTLIAEDFAGNKSEYTIILGKSASGGLVIAFVILVVIIGAVIFLVKKGILKIPDLSSKLGIFSAISQKIPKIDLKSIFAKASSFNIRGKGKKNSKINTENTKAKPADDDSNWENGEFEFESYEEWDKFTSEEDDNTDDWEDE